MWPRRTRFAASSPANRQREPPFSRFITAAAAATLALVNDSWIIRNGRIVDPVRGRETIGDLYITGGVFSATPPAHASVQEFDATGLCVVPGLIDLHVHFREPGHEEAETILTGALAAARGGFTTVVTMPNTTPATDTPDLIAFTRSRAQAASAVRVLPGGALTVARRGLAVADLRGMVAAGACAFTDDGTTPTDEGVLTHALSLARDLHKPFLDHAQDPRLAADGVMHAGARSAELNLPGIPAAAEVRAVERDIRLCAQTGCAVHIQHLSTAAAVECIRAARARGLPITAEATPHHLALTDRDVDGRDANFKMNPPIRSEADRQAILSAVVDGTIQALATDHAPHAANRKAQGFIAAPFGIVGLETAVGITYDLLVASGRMSLIEWFRRWTLGPAEALALPPPGFQPGAPGDVTLLDLDTAWTVDPSRFLSKSRNTPFARRRLHGHAVLTLLSGRQTWRESGPRP
jgi:dihydroorotase